MGTICCSPDFTGADASSPDTVYTSHPPLRNVRVSNLFLHHLETRLRRFAIRFPLQLLILIPCSRNLHLSPLLLRSAIAMYSNLLPKLLVDILQASALRLWTHEEDKDDMTRRRNDEYKEEAP